MFESPYYYNLYVVKFLNQPSLIMRIYCKNGQMWITLEVQIGITIDCKSTAIF